MKNNRKFLDDYLKIQKLIPSNIGLLKEDNKNIVEITTNQNINRKMQNNDGDYRRLVNSKVSKTKERLTEIPVEMIRYNEEISYNIKQMHDLFSNNIENHKIPITTPGLMQEIELTKNSKEIHIENSEWFKKEKEISDITMQIQNSKELESKLQTNIDKIKLLDINKLTFKPISSTNNSVIKPKIEAGNNYSFSIKRIKDRKDEFSSKKRVSRIKVQKKEDSSIQENSIDYQMENRNIIELNNLIERMKNKNNIHIHIVKRSKLINSSERSITYFKRTNYIYNKNPKKEV